MIAFLNGLFAHKTASSVIMDVNGVGYEVHISLNTFSDIQHLEKGLLYTYYHLREDALTLYGFSKEEEKNLFVNLISVSGVGAATARVMLSSMKPEEIIRAITTGNVRQLETIKGIGKKSAERIILELKDKLGKISVGASQNNSVFKSNTLEQDALNALISLGISRSAAEQAVQRVITAEPASRVEDIIKKALKTL
ncbi:MAG TPA: Holliday junction branch migration protein RuvA [Flavitalea sp.]|nr:Holliday junction branch migration protein RuvA [Flavitalea sp.]